MEIITVGGGCFWCMEAVFQQLKGVESVTSGYSGGEKPNPTYEEVCSGNSGHAEVVEVTFDPTIISLHDLLVVFFTLHDPTTLNRQGADVGKQYRSVIFFRDETQRQVALTVMQELADQEVWSDPIVTQLVSFEAFYKAEEYHQDYYNQNQNQGYCRAVIAPKVSKLRAEYQAKLKNEDSK